MSEKDGGKGEKTIILSLQLEIMHRMAKRLCFRALFAARKYSFSFLIAALFSLVFLLFA